MIVDSQNKWTYKNIGSRFNEGTWKNFDIFTYMKWIGQSDKDAPKNLHETTDHADPYGIAMSKIQNFLGNKRSVTVDGKEEEKVDVFTSATQRQSVIAKDKNLEVSGYNIIMTNSPDKIPRPYFDLIRDRDKTISLGFPSKGYVYRDYSDINDLKFEIKKISTEGTGKILNEEILKSFTITRDKDNNFTGNSNDGFSIKGAIDENNKLILKISDSNGKEINLKEFSDCYAKITFIKKYLDSGKEKTLESTNVEHIVPTKISKPVEDLSQVKDESKYLSKIKFKVPESLLDQVTEGSKYIAQKWVKVGEKVLESTDSKDGKFQGNEYEINLSDVSHGDKIRIVSLEKKSACCRKKWRRFLYKGRKRKRI